MSALSFVSKLLGGSGRSKGKPTRKRSRFVVEALEDRRLMSHSGLTHHVPMMSSAHHQIHVRQAPPTQFQQTNLVSDQAGVAQVLDPNLVNPWGISASPNSGAFWLSDNGTARSPLYLGDQNGSPISHLFDVSIPGGLPTGQVFNPFQSNMSNGNSTDFTVTDGTNAGPAVFIFASETGAITGWNPAAGTPGGPFNISLFAQPGFKATDGADYTGLAIGNIGAAHYLYAADFHNGKVDVIDGQFHKTTLAGSFTDPHLPKEFAPFNIQNLGGNLYVTYAKRDAANDGNSVPGKGAGFVDVFDTSGHFLHRVASHGSLNAPWGLAIAPAGFGSFSGDLLVGNFGDGRINAYDPTHNYAFRGQLSSAHGKAVTIPGLWALQVGNGVSSGDTNALYFTAGPNGETHGLFGSLRVVSASQGVARRASS
jgi:uncharacterized protein (TIGR03118 family)